jgi:hypothetical protein
MQARGGAEWKTRVRRRMATEGDKKDGRRMVDGSGEEGWRKSVRRRIELEKRTERLCEKGVEGVEWMG